MNENLGIGAMFFGGIGGFMAWMYFVAWISYPVPPADVWWLPPTLFIAAPISFVIGASIGLFVVWAIDRVKA